MVGRHYHTWTNRPHDKMNQGQETQPSRCVECLAAADEIVGDLHRHYVSYENNTRVPVCPPCHAAIHGDRDHELYPVDGPEADA